MKKLIFLDDAIDKQMFSRDLREFVVPVRILKNLHSVEEPQEQQADYKDMARVLFNRCYATAAFQTSGTMCFFCCLRDACDKMRSVMKPKEE